MDDGAQIYAGMDAGGSKTELVIRASTPPRERRMTGPGANPQRVGLDETGRRLSVLLQRALQPYPEGASLSVCAGVAGAGQAEDRDVLATRLRRSLNADSNVAVRVVHDAVIALEAAFEGKSGLIVIAGTGSIVLARTTTGTLERAGGWGYLLGDEGSGHALGRDGLRAVAHAMDGGPATRLQAAVAERYGLDARAPLIRRVYSKEWALQKAAPLVIEVAEAGDDVARRIVREQTDALARQATWLTERAPPIASRISLSGGLVQEEHYVETLRNALNRHLPNWSLTLPTRPPVTGALRRARRVETANDDPRG